MTTLGDAVIPRNYAALIPEDKNIVRWQGNILNQIVLIMQ